MELYANHSGLMWENAQAAGALIIFAEHRFYGRSLPFGAASPQQPYIGYLSSSQALADYAALLRSIRANFSTGGAPAIAFGGSYGGVLAALFRAGWPGSVAGAVASSAPLRAFPGQAPELDTALYYEVISRNLGAAGGAPPACADNVRATFPALFADGATPAGRAALTAAFRTCAPIATPDDAKALAFWLRAAWDSLSMANYPYASDYITFPAILPAFPVRAACAALAAPLSGAALYAAHAAAVATLYNATLDPAMTCNDIPPNPNAHPADPYDGIWDFQQCTEMMPDSQWFATRAGSTVFWDEPRNLTFLIEHCRAAWGVEPALDWITTRYALPDFTGVSNIVFANGLYDPWSGASLARSPAPERDLIAINISEGAHHLDLFFANAADPPSVTAARAVQVALLTKWIAEAR